jgi:hypothetical protein
MCRTEAIPVRHGNDFLQTLDKSFAAQIAITFCS